MEGPYNDGVGHSSAHSEYLIRMAFGPDSVERGEDGDGMPQVLNPVHSHTLLSVVLKSCQICHTFATMGISPEEILTNRPYSNRGTIMLPQYITTVLK